MKYQDDLTKIAEPNTLENDGGKLRARFYLEDLEKKIESEKILMADKIWEDIQRYAGNQRKSIV